MGGSEEMWSILPMDVVEDIVGQFGRTGIMWYGGTSVQIHPRFVVRMAKQYVRNWKHAHPVRRSLQQHTILNAQPHVHAAWNPPSLS